MDIFVAIGAGDLDRVNQLLLEDGTIVNSFDPDTGYTPLSEAAANGNIDIGLALITHGADVNKFNMGGSTSLMVAAAIKQTDFVTFLLEQPNINVDLQGINGITALRQAVVNKSISVTQLLLESGADPNIADKDGNTPLYFAVDEPEIVKLLLLNDANVNAKGNSGDTPLIVAIIGQRLASVNLLLLNPNIDVDLANNTGETPLMAAAAARIYGKTKLDYLNALIRAGADPFMVDQHGETALDYAQSALRGKVDPDKELLLKQAMENWTAKRNTAVRNFDQKFIVARRLRQGTQTTQGYTLELPSRDLTEGLIRKSEYDNLCMGLQNNLNKPGIIALARSLRIPTSNQTKSQLCNEIAKRLTL